MLKAPPTCAVPIPPRLIWKKIKIIFEIIAEFVYNTRTYPDIDRREGGSFTRAEARNEDAGAAMKALRQGRMTQPQAEEMTSLPKSNIGIGSMDFDELHKNFFEKFNKVVI